MVEGRVRNKQQLKLPGSIAPNKKFLNSKEAEEIKEPECAPKIPQRPLQLLHAPKLPKRSNYQKDRTIESTGVKSENFYPLEDDIFNELKPQLTTIKFYFINPNHQSQSQLSIIPQMIPPDFIPKIFLLPETETEKETDLKMLLLGLQHGKVIQMKLNIDDAALTDNLDLHNRQFYDLIQLKSLAILAFQDTGIIFKVDRKGFTPILRDALPRGTAKVIQRPEIDEIWVIGLRETSILLTNREGDVALIRKIPTHFPEATSISFINAEELAVQARDRSIKLYSVARHGHQPALIATLPPIVIGDVIKIFKLNNWSYGTIYSDGKMIIWKFENNEELSDKIIVPLTLYRIQSVHLAPSTTPHSDSNLIIWLGLVTGKLLVVQVQVQVQKNREISVKILGQAKYHQASISKFIPVVNKNKNWLVTIDSSGQLCTWDSNLSFYKLNKVIWEREAEYCSYERVSLRICSWNVAAQAPNDCTDSVAQKWLLGDENGGIGCDIIVVSLQEIVDLNARSFISGSTGGNGTNQSQNCLDQWIRFISNKLPDHYKLVHSSVMVGLGLIVFCRDCLQGALSSVSDDFVKTGLGGLHGNKGGLVWRSFVHDLPVAFVSVHLAAGQAAINERNNDLTTILRSANLSEATTSRKDPFAFSTGNSGTRLFDHSVLFLAGDMNYRIDLDRLECLNGIKSGNYDKIGEKDQLNLQMMRKELLIGYFSESQAISKSFAPTYKYDRGAIDRFDSSEKGRIPAWCDRILFYKKPEIIMKSSDYTSIPEATLSDHKPIFANFELKCRKINWQARDNLIKNYLKPPEGLLDSEASNLL